MRNLRNPLLVALVLLQGACAMTGAGPPPLAGYVNAPPPAIAGDDSLLTYTVWVWQDTQLANGTRVVPDVVGRYAIEFQPGGVVNVRADCNRGSGKYTQNGAQLTFGSIALTKVMCPPGSRDGEFIKGLGSVSEQSLRGNDLVLTLRDASSMRFTTPRP
jgi:heat shock protein HslJ